jgi:hypothetical protein
MTMSLENQMIKKMKVPLFFMLVTILISFLAPGVLAEPIDPSERYESEMAADANLMHSIDSYFAVVNYNEPSIPWVQINYYYENGSQITMIFGVDRTIYPTLNLDYNGPFIQVFDKKGKISGFGIRMKTKSNLFVFVPA